MCIVPLLLLLVVGGGRGCFPEQRQQKTEICINYAACNRCGNYVDYTACCHDLDVHARCMRYLDSKQVVNEMVNSIQRN